MHVSWASSLFLPSGEAEPNMPLWWQIVDISHPFFAGMFGTIWVPVTSKGCVILSHPYSLFLMKVREQTHSSSLPASAPLIVEVITYSCFCYLMKRLLPNFPHGAGMDEHFNHMRSLLQILDCELYQHIHRTGDFTHFYFCYRWFLLDFKRGSSIIELLTRSAEWWNSLRFALEFVYEDIFLVWETIAAARRTVSKRFVLFIALAMLKSYRDIILDNRMDFTDIIRFFNGKSHSNLLHSASIFFSLLEMAERHDAREILRVARELVLELQKLIDNK